MSKEMNHNIDKLVLQWHNKVRTEKGPELNMCTKRWSYLSRMTRAHHMFLEALADSTVRTYQEV